MLPIHVINLATSNERRDRISARLNALKIPFEIFPAVDGRTQPHPLFARYNDKKRQRYRRKRLAGGELGCFASHYLLWQKCVELNQPIVVMEDDVNVSGQMTEAVTEAEKLIGSLRYIRLAGTSLHRRPYKVIDKAGNFELIDHIRGPSGTLCYVISPSAAKDLIAHADEWFLAVDDYMDRYWAHGVDCFSLMPFVVTVAESGGSDIVRANKEKAGLTVKLVQELCGRAERLRRLLYRMNRHKTVAPTP
jgi:glycosyl transferase family 25